MRRSRVTELLEALSPFARATERARRGEMRTAETVRQAEVAVSAADAAIREAMVAMQRRLRAGGEAVDGAGPRA